MDLTVEEFIDGLFSKEAREKPSDSVKPEQLDLVMPKWFNEKEYNKGRRFFWDHIFVAIASMMLGLVVIMSVPSILRVLIGTFRSSTSYTAYKRYFSTVLHTLSWFEHDLKPGSTSWKSLREIRSRHLRAGLAGKLKGYGVVSQRDLALTQFGFMGLMFLKPDQFGVRQLQEGDWEAYNYFWRVIGYMIGIEDRYNICRNTPAETREVCQILLQRVFTPCMTNVPEYYEHMSRVLLEGMLAVAPLITVDYALFISRYMAEVPGYVMTEAERIDMQKKIKEYLKSNGKNEEFGVDPAVFLSKPAVEDVPERGPETLYYRDFHNVEGSLAYKKLQVGSKIRLTIISMLVKIFETNFGRICINIYFKITLYATKFLPLSAILTFGPKAAKISLFAESPVDDTKPKPNSYYYELDQQEHPLPWYLKWIPEDNLNYFSYVR